MLLLSYPVSLIHKLYKVHIVIFKAIHNYTKEEITMEENNPTNITHRFRKTGRRDYWKIATVVLAVLLIVSVYRGGWMTGASVLNSDEAGQKAITYINDNLMPATIKAELKSIAEENGLYKLIILIDQQEVPLFSTKDGNLIFVQYFDTTKELPALDTQANEAQAEIVKSDKPVVEVFIMSHCPYGTQIEKGILPVAEALGNKIDFQIKFVNYAMHGEVEVKEQLNQYCIIEEQNDKYYTYLNCFLKEGKGDACLAEAKIDTKKMNTCLDAAEKEFKTLALFADKTTWQGGQFPQFPIHDALNKKYGVQGSPTMVINGVQVSSARDSASLLKTICSAFNEAPDACNSQLSSATPSPGFGLGTATSSTTADCATS